MLKNFMKGIAKAAAAIVLAVLVLAVIGYGIGEFRDAGQRRDAKPLEEVKIWTPNVHESLGVKVRVRTKLVNGTLYAEFFLDGYPPYLSTPGPRERNAERQVTMEFRDKDGFKVFDRSIQIREFTTIVGKDSAPAGLRYQFTLPVAVDEYRRWATAHVGWNLDTEIPRTDLFSDLVEQKPLRDHCAPGLSKTERLKRLAQHGTVRETGAGDYAAGERSVTFFSDGGLLNCR